MPDDLIEVDTVAFTVFQVAREAVHDALKHAEAKSIQIELTTTPDFRMIVCDDGKGIEVAQRHDANTNGLRIMRYRAESIGGRLEIESPRGVGTKVILTIPQRNCRL